MVAFLNVQTLCTARLVCKRFRRFALSHLKALHLDSTALDEHPTPNLTQFAGLTHLAVTVVRDKQLHLLTHPGIAPLVTHVQMQKFHLYRTRQHVEGIAQLTLLPSLRSLSLYAEVRSELEMLPANLEDLWLMGGFIGDLSLLTRFSGLTSLRIAGAGASGSLRGWTSLSNLQSLDVCGNMPILPMLSTFTSLTSLTWTREFRNFGPGDLFPCLAGLTGLSELKLSESLGYVRRDDLACLPVLTRLTCLDMGRCSFAQVSGRVVCSGAPHPPGLSPA
jgi:hypothetical protein